MTKRLVLILLFAARAAGVALVFLIPPIWAIIANILIDYLDGPFYKHYLKVPNVRAQYYDKFWDYLYYVALLIIIFRLRLAAAPLLVFLFAFRTVGEFIFFVTGNKKIFVYFPNFFEYFVFGVLLVYKFNWGIDVQIVLFGLIIVYRIWNEIFLHRNNKTFFHEFWLPLFRFLRFGFAKRIK